LTISLTNVSSFNILTINNLIVYQNIDNSVNRILASSIVIATINKESYNPENSVIVCFGTKTCTTAIHDSYRVFNAQDKILLVFQFLSITCFLGIIIHEITVRIINPQKYT
jgi:hypothetical protein